MRHVHEDLGGGWRAPKRTEDDSAGGVERKRTYHEDWGGKCQAPGRAERERREEKSNSNAILVGNRHWKGLKNPPDPRQVWMGRGAHWITAAHGGVVDGIVLMWSLSWT